MEEKVLISAIVPIYNVEAYLERCIKSIIGQTYNNIEILLIDDGSKDNSLEICKRFEKLDKRIRVFHKGNGGLSDARNYGIDRAKGEYLVFIDSDDYIENRYVEELVKLVTKDNLKVAQCGFNKVRDNQILEKTNDSNNCVQSGRKMVIDFYGENESKNIVVWNKIYRKDLFEKLRFPCGKIHEDEYVTYKILYQEEKVGITNECLYNYSFNPDSITQKKYNIKRLDAMGAYQERISYFKNKKDNELMELTTNFYLTYLKVNFVKIKLYVENSKKYEKNIIKEFRKYYKEYYKNKKNVKSNFVFFHFPYLYFILAKKFY